MREPPEPNVPSNASEPAPSRDKLLMIPGPVEVSPAVVAAFGGQPPGHLGAAVLEAFGASLEMMREVWCASAESQPFIVAGSGTIAMDMAVGNVVEPGERVLVVDTGYFSERMAEMLRRRGARVERLRAASCDTVAPSAVAAALDAGEPFAALFATHVDTSTGVRIDAEGIARAAAQREVLSVFDGVCATAAERFEMANWGADVYLSASQKAIGLPAGLALLVASPRAMAARRALRTPPPMAVDFLEWLPIMEAYEGRRPSYFSTPATNHVVALEVALRELLETRDGALRGMAARFALHARVGAAMRAAWSALGLELLPASDAIAAHTLSAVLYPPGVDASLVGRIAQAGVIVAGGLLAGRKGDYFRVGHMGYSATQPAMLLRTIEAVEQGLRESGFERFERGAAAAAARRVLERSTQG